MTSSVVYWARDGDQLFIYVREKGMGLIFRIVWFDDMNVLLKSYRFGRTSGDISQYIYIYNFFYLYIIIFLFYIILYIIILYISALMTFLGHTF